MAQNLNYTPAQGNSRCPISEAGCATYGLMYDYPTADTICPSGWRLPDTSAWDSLEAAAGGLDSAGTKLKSASPLWVSGGIAGDNFTGFSALPAGYFDNAIDANGALTARACWWTSDDTSGFVEYRSADYNKASVYHSSLPTYSYFSVRCEKK